MRQLSTLMEDLEGERAEAAPTPAVAAAAAEGFGRRRHFSASARATLRRQLSEAAPRTSAEHMGSDELGELMWEMRPRFATSAGELKRRKKHEWLDKERERKEVGGEKGGTSKVLSLALRFISRYYRRCSNNTVMGEKGNKQSI